MPISDQLLLLNQTKQAIKSAIESKGQTVGGIPFSQYPSKINLLGGETSLIVPYDPLPWVRPVEWPVLDMPVDGTFTIQAIVAVYENGINKVSFNVTGGYISPVTSGGFTVDWGDNSSNVHVLGDTFSHVYDYSNVNLIYVADGAYKCAKISITFDEGCYLSAFTNVVSFGEWTSHLSSSLLLDIVLNSSYLDSINFATVSSFANSHLLQRIIIGECSLTSTNSLCSNLHNLRVFEIRNNLAVVVSAVSMFNNCYNLSEVILFDTSNITLAVNMFSSCYSLTEIPSFNFSSLEDASSMFSGCSKLKDASVLILPNTVAIITNMFQDCYNLIKAPALKFIIGDYCFYNCSSLESIPDETDFSLATSATTFFSNCCALKKAPSSLSHLQISNMSSFFYNCFSLVEVTNLNLSQTTSISSIFYKCTSLRSVNSLDLANLQSIRYAFYNCSSLSSINLLNCESVLDSVYCFYGCTSLSSVNFLNMLSVVYASRMFGLCYSLTNVEGINMPQVQDISYMFYADRSLVQLKNITFGSLVSNFTYVFINCHGLMFIDIDGIDFSFSVANFNLGTDALNHLFTKLVPAASTITITGCPGRNTCDTTIATNKGWTVVI